MAGIDQTIAFVSKEDVKTSAGDWLLNSNNGQGVPGHTFTFNASAALKSLIVNDDDGMFSDDDLPNQPISWGGDALGQTVAAGSEVGEVGKGVEAEYLLTMTATIDGELKTFEILVVQQGGKTIGYAFKGEIPPFGVTLKATGYLDSTQGPGGTYNPVGTPYKDIVTCFAAGTMIQTSTGARAIEKLNVGDKVLTKDSGYQELRWIGSTAISAQQLSARPKLTPVRITAGALGDNTPQSDLVVSPEHRILLRSSLSRKHFGANEVLVAAKHLVPIDGIDFATDLSSVEYFHMLFDRHEIVLSNGAETESLYTGPVAMMSLSDEAREEILTLFPELAGNGHVPESARPLPSPNQARKLVAHHAQHDKAVVA